jgi:hypothetical protein
LAKNTGERKVVAGNIEKQRVMVIAYHRENVSAR